MASETWRAGDEVGPWILVGPLARGGMDDVYEAVHRDTGERAAIKSPRDDDPIARARFERGARLALSLRHPRIVAAREAGRRGEAPYLALELLRGEDLGRRLRRGPLPLAEAVAVAGQVCEALAFAHARRIVHRDITPANLFLCEGDAVDVRVLDFGLARVEGARSVSMEGGVVGTIPYLSPEQVTSARDVDGRSDLWSLGVVLYQALAGALPFEADSAYGTLWQIVTATAPPLAPRRPDAPAALVDVVERALRRDREHRFPSAEAMGEALQRCSVGGERAVAGVERPPDAWLSAVACAREVRDVAALTRAAEALGATALHLAQERVFFATFGQRRWQGDEPRLAAEFAAASLRFARGAGVATGRPGGAHDVAARAAALARASEGRVALDGDTARMAGERVVSQSLPPAPLHVGRTAELGLLQGAVEGARAQAIPRAVVVLAQQGLGKSRLLREAVARVGATPTPMVVACEAAHRDAPLAALDALLGAPAAPPGEASADPQVPLDRARAALSAALSAGAAVLCVDDAQWLDAASREVIRRVYEDGESPFALWLFATPEARATLCALCPDATVCELAPLAPDDARSLLRVVAPTLPPEAAEALVERAEGHPLFLESLAHWRAGQGDGDDELPATIQAVFQSMLGRMGVAEREFLRCASVYGRTAWVEGAAALGANGRALASLRRAGHLTPRPSRVAGATEVAFRSGLLRDVAYELWPEGDRPERHRLAAAWLAAHPGERDEEIARHWDLAAEPARAGAHYAAAAERAARVAGPAAVELAALALARTDAPPVRWRALLARDTATQIDGDRARHAEGVAALEALAPSLGVAEMAEAAWRRCYFCRVTARDDEARAAAALAIDLADGADAPRVAAQARVELALMDANEGQLARASAHAEAAEEAARREGDPWLVARAQTTLGYVRNEGGRVAEALGLFDAAVAAYARADDRRREAIALANGGAVLLRLGRTGESLERFARALDLSRRVGNPSTVAVASQNLATLHRALGRFDLCRASLDEAERIARKLRRARLDAALAIERAYLALAADAPWAERRDAGRRGLAAARSSRSPLLVASAVAVALRAEPSDEALAAEAVALRAELASQAEAAAELAVALHAAGAGVTRAEVDAAVARFVASAGDIDDPVACAEVFRRRCLAPT